MWNEEQNIKTTRNKGDIQKWLSSRNRFEANLQGKVEEWYVTTETSQNFPNL